MDKNTKKVKKIIKDNIYLTLATASKEGKPWVSPLFFAYDKNYNMYWVSNKDAKHSKLVRENSSVAITIFDSSAPEGQGDGVYFEAVVKELSEDEEILSAMRIMNKRVSIEAFKTKKISWVKGVGVWRIYKANPKKAWTLSEGEINGQYVDMRVEVNLE